MTEPHRPPAEVPSHIRPINFAGIELLLDMLHSARKFYGDVDMESLLILLCVSDATMRAFMLDPDLAAANLHKPRPEDEVRGFISRRSIADKLGLARETVRRKTSELAATGKLTIDEADRVRIAYGLIDLNAWRAIEEGHRSVLRYLDRLDQFNVSARDIVHDFLR